MKIILIGIMGVGKTTIGKELSKKLNFKMIDMDDEIEKDEKMTISNIFDKYGEDKFREIESNLLRKLILEDNIIISTGGGIIKKEENINLLKNEDNVIFLDGNIETILRHLYNNGVNSRPLLKNSKNLKETIKNILDERYEKYKQSSTIQINVDNKNIDEVVSQILVYIS
ncbi:MAG: shikimate kinase [Romboutsia sp.]|nr:shikimate kinase [Romboutsia sp.]